MSKSRIVIGLMLVLSIFGSCQKRGPKVLSENKTVEVLADLQIAEAYMNNNGGYYGSDEKNNVIEGILKNHGITQEELDSTLSYYGKNIDDYYKLFDKVAKLIDRKSEKYYIPNKSEDEQNNLWPYPSHAYLTSKAATDGLIFSLEDLDILSGDKVEWSLKINKDVVPEAMMGLEYTDGSSAVVRRSSGGTRELKLLLQSDTTRQVKRLFGYFRIPSNDLPLWLDSIKLIKLPLDTLDYNQIRMVNNIYRPKKKPLKIEKDTIENNESGPTS